MSEAHNKLAKILRVKPELLLDLEERMSKITGLLTGQAGKSGVIEEIVKENDILVKRTIEEFGLPESLGAREIYEVLIKRIERMDDYLFKFLGEPDLFTPNSCAKLCETARALNNSDVGLFIKKIKAVEMLENFPPNNLLTYFGCNSVKELLEKQDLSSVLCALRLVHGDEWMHAFFEQSYQHLSEADFEEREIEIKVLEPFWLDVARKFIEKKFHNVSHLKEFGIIFITPTKLGMRGETLRTFMLLLHYLNEVPFYNKLFRKIAKSPNFPAELESLLRGDVSSAKISSNGEVTWRIVQRYLAKDDPNDFRLFEPHVNPEAEHWYKAEGDFGKLATIAGAEAGHTFGYWRGLDSVGDFFKDDGGEKLVSFDLIDLTMSLAKNGDIKYLYHQQEALWNRIFVKYMGREKMNELIEENILEGFIKL